METMSQETLRRRLQPEKVGRVYQRAATELNRLPTSTDHWNPILESLISQTPPDRDGSQLNHLQRYANSPAVQECLRILLNTSIETVQRYDRGELGQINVAGHDMENNTHVAYQVLRMAAGLEEKIGRYAAWELAESAVLHNVGRWLGHGDEVHQATGASLVMEIAQQLLVKVAHPARKKIFARVISDIAGHSGKNLGDPIADLVRSADRFQQIVPLGPFRELLYDVGKTNVPIFPPINDELRDRIPLGIKESSWLHWVEFMARNLFPFYDQEANPQNTEVFQEIMKVNQVEADRRRSFSVGMLMVLTDYKVGRPAEEQTDMTRQVFSPEFNLTSQNRHWSKRTFPEHIFNEGERAYQRYLEGVLNRNHTATQDSKLWLANFLEATNSYVDPNALETINQRLSGLTGGQTTRVLAGLEFCFEEYIRELQRERMVAESSQESSDSSVAKLGEYVVSYLDSKFATNSSFSSLRGKLAL